MCKHTRQTIQNTPEPTRFPSAQTVRNTDAGRRGAGIRAKALGAWLSRGAVCIAALLSASCASTGKHYTKIEPHIYAGDFEGAFNILVEEAPSAYDKKDSLLFQLDAGMLAHYAADWETSRDYLADAERSIENLYAKSVTLTVASYLANDTVTEYSGEDYEDVYINIFNAMNYFFLGSTEDALVEIRRIDEKLRFLSVKHGTEITTAQQALLDNGTAVPYDSEAASVHFSNSALARYLGMLFYRANGQKDDARIDRDQIRLAFANQPDVYNFPVPDSIDDELDIPEGKARLNVISFTGLSPEKRAEEIRIPIGGNWVKISLPVLEERGGDVAWIKVIFDSGEEFQLDVIEEMGNVAAETFKQKAGLIYLKTVLRATSKTAASIAFGEASDTQDSNLSLLFSVLSLGTQLYAEFSEQADLRISQYFPATAWVGGTTVTPGMYSYSVVYYSASGKPLYEDRFENVAIREKGLNLTESVCLR